MGLLQAGMHIHLIGIGGIGLSAIARVLHGWGCCASPGCRDGAPVAYRVSGSDRRASALTRELAAEGITVYEGHRAEQVAGADLVIVSSAIPPDNPEVLEAQRCGRPVLKREQFLGALTAGKFTIAVAGAHGKTTTTAMIAWVLSEAGLDPTFIVGGVLQNLNTNARAGSGPHFVIEADEYDRAFLGLRPDLAVITTLEHDHPDCYPTFDDMRQAFAEFAGRVVEGGLLLVCGDDAEARRLGEFRGGGGCRVQTYGLDAAWDWQARVVNLENSARFQIWRGGECFGDCALQVPGRHNVSNALAALAVSWEVGVAVDTAISAITRFRGTQRRFEIKGQAAGVTVVDDYAHHPTEVQATLGAARIKYAGRTLWAVFQPHTYSRTAALLDDFVVSFADADHVLVTHIYAARETDTLGVSGKILAERMEHPEARYVETLAEAADFLAQNAQPGDVVITLGAGDGYLVGEWLLKRLAGDG